MRAQDSKLLIKFACPYDTDDSDGDGDDYDDDDNDNDGWVIHTYLVYALGAAMAVACFSMARGAARASPRHRTILSCPHRVVQVKR